MGQRTDAELVALKDTIVKQTNVLAFYNSHLPGDRRFHSLKSDGWTRELAFCPIHNDTKTPNFNANIYTGAFVCHGCGKRGSIFDFYCLMHKMDPRNGKDFAQALAVMASAVGIDVGTDIKLPVVPEGSEAPTERLFNPKKQRVEFKDATTKPLSTNCLDKYFKLLSAEHYKYLRFHRGLLSTTIEEYRIGWHPKKVYKNTEGLKSFGKYIIPVFGKGDFLRNLRLYARDGEKGCKMMNLKGYGSPARLFPLDKLKGQHHIIYCEGEWDCILLNQELKRIGKDNDWLAMTNTAGGGVFEEEWIQEFEGRHVYFMFDVDTAGRNFAEVHANQKLSEPLSTGKILSLKIVHLPLPGSKEEKDVTDFLMKREGTIEQILALIDNTEPLEFGGVDDKDLVTPHVEVSDFLECTKDRRYIDQRVRVPLTISGQSSKVYHATREMKVVSCPARAKDNCCSHECQIIPYGNPAFIESSMANRKQMNAVLQELICTKGQKCTIEETDKVVMEEYMAHQVMERLTAEEDEQTGKFTNSQELVAVPVYVLQPEQNMKIGPQSYYATGYIRSHPMSRGVCMFIEKLEPMDEDWKAFRVTPEVRANFQIIQDYKNVNEILDEIQNSVTRIYEAKDILLTILLTYLSPIRFSFNGDFIRGWINSCIIGDSGTGKTRTYDRISNWINEGDLFSTLSGSRTGLLYAVKQRGNDWYVQIGRYVMASGKIMAIDETQEMEAEEIQKMGKAMDEGWLEVSRVASGGYKTETRTLLLMNPKNGRTISDYAFGCRALPDCFRKMFIRRLDVAVFSTGKEDPTFYNKKFDKDVNNNVRINSRIFKNLVHWAWTRSSDQVLWTQEATDECLAQSVEIAKTFGHADDVPLVNFQDFRNKLARLSTAFAILCGSFSDDYESVRVLPLHVIKMAKFYAKLYSDSACNLRQHSKNSSKKKVLGSDHAVIAKNFEDICKEVDESRIEFYREGQHFLQMLGILQEQQHFRMRDIAQQLGVSGRWVNKHCSVLIMHNLIEISGSSYKATRRFNLFMQEWQKSQKVENMMEKAAERRGKHAMSLKPEQMDHHEEETSSSRSPYESGDHF